MKGTTGYSEAVQRFITATMAVDFFKLHEPFISLIPVRPSCVLDVGAGIGRDAHVFAEMGHDVVAVEPTLEFLVAAKKLHHAPNINWIEDSLPTLSKLGERTDQFDFILASAILHHLDETERLAAMVRLTALLKQGGVLALSLRQGPAGVGTHVFPTSGRRTIECANARGLTTLVHLQNQPSLMSFKKEVSWTRLAFAKIS